MSGLLLFVFLVSLLVLDGVLVLCGGRGGLCDCVIEGCLLTGMFPGL